MNPCTLGWYLPLIVKDVPGALQPSDGKNELLKSTVAGSAMPGGLQSSGPNRHKARNGSADANISGVSHDLGMDHPAANSGAHNVADMDTDAGAMLPASGPGSGSGSGLHVAVRASQRQGRGTGAGGEGAGARDGLGGVSWQELDAKFRRDLPDEAYVGRLGYRGLVMRACPAIRLLDGIEVSTKEREKAERLLCSVLGPPKDRDGGAAGVGAG